MTEKPAPRIFDSDRVLSNLFSKKISPEEAAKKLQKGYKQLKLSNDEAFERIKTQDRLFQEGNWEIAQEEMIQWHQVTAILEEVYEIPGENRLSKIENGGKA